MTEAPPPAHDHWSPLRPAEWAGVFIAGFCAMVLFFFRFYAGVFAREIYAQRELEIPVLTQWALEGALPLVLGISTAAVLIATLLPPVARAPRARLGALFTSLGLGVLGVVATLWGLYAPLL